MSPTDDETLMAYADGMLPDPDKARVERFPACDAPARRLVTVFWQVAMLVRVLFARSPLPAAAGMPTPADDSVPPGMTSKPRKD